MPLITSYKQKKVLIVTNIPTPYRIPLFNELNVQFQKQGVKLKVVFGAPGYMRRKWKFDREAFLFDYEMLASRKISNSGHEETIFTYKGLCEIVKQERPNVIITAGFSFATMKICFLSWFFPAPYLIWSGSINSKGNSDSFFRKIQRKMLVRQAAGFIAYGTQASNYLISLGAEPKKIHISFNTTDVEYYKTETEKIRKELKYRDKKKNLLYIGYITKGKRLDLLLCVLESLVRKRQDFVLKIVGSGPTSEDIKKLVNKSKLTDFVRFEGFKQKSDIPLYLAEADCFLFPSEYDIWGLVLVEAMAAGIPCIASIHAGATVDLIKDGVTGFAVDFSETERVAERIDWILENLEMSKKIGQNASQFIVENLSLERSAAVFVNTVEKFF